MTLWSSSSKGRAWNWCLSLLLLVARVNVGQAQMNPTVPSSSALQTAGPQAATRAAAAQDAAGPQPSSGSPAAASASQAPTRPIAGDQPSTWRRQQGSETLHVIVGRSLFLDTPERLQRVYVSNPAVFDTVTPTPRQLVLTAKIAGTSTVAVWTENASSTIYTVVADLDIDGLRSSLTQGLPGDVVKVEAQEGKILLSGTVGSDLAAEHAAKLAAVYSKDVVNSLLVDPRHLPQVQLKVRFAELDRSKLTQFGINLFAIGKNTGSSTTGQFSAPTFPQIGGSEGNKALLNDVLNLFYFNLPNGVGVTVKDLQNKGILEVLAEPNLMTLHGVPAKFLAGGEFPYPVIQPGSGGGTATVTIQFRPYGVKLEFTPYVNSDGSIRLKVAPEVSALDYSNVVVIAGYTLPSLSTRKAETEIELRDGQTFGISGILDHRTTDNLSKVPGIADIPILGHLFRSKNLNSAVTELIVVVTPTIVDPLSTDESPPPADPNWLVPPGQLGNFNQGLPKSYERK